MIPRKTIIMEFSNSESCSCIRTEGFQRGRMSLNRLENPTGGWLNWSGNGQSRSTPEAEKDRTTHGIEVDDGAIGDGREDFEQKAERKSSTMVDPPPLEATGRKSPKNELPVLEWCMDGRGATGGRQRYQPSWRPLEYTGGH